MTMLEDLNSSFSFRTSFDWMNFIEYNNGLSLFKLFMALTID